MITPIRLDQAMFYIRLVYNIEVQQLQKCAYTRSMKTYYENLLRSSCQNQHLLLSIHCQELDNFCLDCNRQELLYLLVK